MKKYSFPDARGYFDRVGGKFVPETLMKALEELEEAYRTCAADPVFQQELSTLLTHYVGRPSPVYHAARLSREIGKGKIYLKREDLNHTGAHKINNTLGQVMLASRMGKERIIAETGAGQHGVATATAAAVFGLGCEVYMGEEDIRRQHPNVERMKILGAEVHSVTSGSRTLKDAINETMRDWVTNIENTFYVLGSVMGPHPYPMMVRDFQSVIGDETRTQILELEGKQPDYIVACVGGGSNAMGLFYPFIEDESVRMIGVEAAGEGMDTPRHCATLCKGRMGVLHGSRSYLLQNSDGQVMETHSISAGLDYPGVGPEHSWLKDSGRAEYVSVTDQEALEAFYRLSELEGIIPALESSHAVAHLWKMDSGEDDIIVVCLSGRGDKDLQTVLEDYERNR